MRCAWLVDCLLVCWVGSSIESEGEGEGQGVRRRAGEDII